VNLVSTPAVQAPLQAAPAIIPRFQKVHCEVWNAGIPAQQHRVNGNT